MIGLAFFRILAVDTNGSLLGNRNAGAEVFRTIDDGLAIWTDLILEFR